MSQRSGRVEAREAALAAGRDEILTMRHTTGEQAVAAVEQADTWVARSLREGETITVATADGDAPLTFQHAPGGYSSALAIKWGEGEAERVALADWLSGLADDLRSGKATIRGEAVFTFYHRLGRDFDGKEGVNLDSGDRSFAIEYHRPGDRQV